MNDAPKKIWFSRHMDWDDAEELVKFCDSHCTWLDHHPDCPLKERYISNSPKTVEPARKTIDEELFEQWRQHINDEIFKAKSYLQCLYQLNDAAILSSYFCGFKPTMKVENMTEAALKKLEEE